MTDAERNDIASIFARLAVEAGRAILSVRLAGAPAGLKSDGSPVTEADLAADHCIRMGLAAALPGIPVVTEESAESHVATGSDRFILVDPLDGTREFVAGRDEFTVNIALIDSGVPIAGAIYAPALGRLYVAGAEARDLDVQPDAPVPSWQDMQKMAAVPVPASAWRAVASRSHLDEDTKLWMSERPIGEFCAAGSSLKFCAVAQGGADVYPRMATTMEWDTAAGHAILLAAGGTVETADGAPLRYGKHADGFRNPPFIAWGRRS